MNIIRCLKNWVQYHIEYYTKLFLGQLLRVLNMYRDSSDVKLTELFVIQFVQKKYVNIYTTSNGNLLISFD